MSSVLEQTREDERLHKETGQAHQMEHYLSETDHAAVEQLAERYKHVVPPERVEAVREHPSLFMEDRDVFDATYEKESGEKPQPDAKVLGYSTGTTEGPRIATDYLEVPKTVYHERLHQLSSPEVRGELGQRLDEGITEDLAIENLGAEPLQDGWQTYPEERAVAHELRGLCGDEAVERAYFKGDTRQLRRCLDEALGDGGLEKLRERLGDSPEPPERRL